MIRLLKNSVLPVLVLVCMHAQAQFKNKAALASVVKTGFYAIAVTPELSSYIKTDFSDLRVMDEKGQQVPYVIRGSVVGEYDTTYTQLKIIQSRQDDSGRTIITIENVERASLSSIAVLIRNASVSRNIDITGSDDNLHWFSIIDNGILGKREITDTDRYVQAISFPLSSYRYFKLTVYNGKNAPLNIISAGVYKFTGTKNKSPLIYNPVSNFVQIDSSDGTSYIHIIDSNAFHKLVIKLVLKGEKFFYRSGKIIEGNKIIGGINIFADTALSTISPVFNAKDWWIRIYNGDNPPLKVTSVITAQELTQVVAWLDSGKVYHLEMNDSSAVAPVYDLQQFKDSIPNNVTEIKYFNIQPLEIVKPVPATSFFKQAWIWPVMIGVLALLVLFTMKLAKEMNGRGG